MPRRKKVIALSGLKVPTDLGIENAQEIINAMAEGDCIVAKHHDNLYVRTDDYILVASIASNQVLSLDRLQPGETNSFWEDAHLFFGTIQESDTSSTPIAETSIPTEEEIEEVEQNLGVNISSLKGCEVYSDDAKSTCYILDSEHSKKHDLRPWELNTLERGGYIARSWDRFGDSTFLDHPCSSFDIPEETSGVISSLRERFAFKTSDSMSASDMMEAE